MKDSKFLDYNLKLNQEYFIVADEHKWRLMRNKFVIYEIMNSENNTEEELKQFMKEHQMYDYMMIAGEKAVLMAFALSILALVNIKLQSTELRFLILGALCYTLVEFLVRNIVITHNDKVREKILKEDMKFFDSIKEKLERKLSNEEKRHIRNKKNTSTDM